MWIISRIKCAKLHLLISPQKKEKNRERGSCLQTELKDINKAERTVSLLTKDGAVMCLKQTLT